MILSLHRRIMILLAPLLLLTILQGGGAVVLLYRLHQKINQIHSENYDSVRAMELMLDALGSVDAALQKALLLKDLNASDPNSAQHLFETSWLEVEQQLTIESHNITIHPQEDELVDQLNRLLQTLKERSRTYFALPELEIRRQDWMVGTNNQPGLITLLHDVRTTAKKTLRINQLEIEEASNRVRKLAFWSLLFYSLALLLTLLVAAWVIWRLATIVLRPIEAITRAARAIGDGNLHRLVPVIGEDELAQLARTFNTMTQRLRDYRQSRSETLLRSQKTSQATIDSFSDPVLVIDPQGRVELANPAARQAFGVIPGTQSADSLALQWQPPETLRQPLIDALIKHQAYLTTTFDQVINLRFNDQERAFLPQIRPIQDAFGDTLGAAVVFNDVTRFRLMDQLKTDLVQTVSHEIKTPLANIRLALHFLLEEVIGPFNAKQAELLMDARDNAERLQKMIEHLLALARLEQGVDVLHLQPLSVADLIREASDSLVARAESKRISLVIHAVDTLPPIGCDPVRLRLALQNLLDNAITYTDPGGKVTLSAELADASSIRLVVSDSGVGISQEYLPHVFEKFFRVPDVSQPEGTGLGLAIVKEIISSHRGSISCVSSPGQGTSFLITLPIWKEVK